MRHAGLLILITVFTPCPAFAEDTTPSLIERSCRDTEGRPASWMDRSHAYLNRKLCEPAAWFDGFFADKRADEETPVYTYFRLRNELYWSGDDDLRFRTRLFSKIKLPRASKRLRLLISRDADLQGDFIDTSPRRDPSDNRTQLGLSYLARDNKKSQLNIDTGLHAKIPIEPYLKARYRYTLPITNKTLTRLTETLFWEYEDGFGATTRLDWEWLPNRDSLLRLSASANISEISDGIDWRSDATWFRQLSQQRALRIEAGAFGYTRPRFGEDETYIAVGYRRRFLRPWLYYEIQPEYAWINQGTDAEEGIWRIMLMLELHFESKAGLTGLIKH